MQVSTCAKARVHQPFALQGPEGLEIRFIPIMLKEGTVIPGKAQQLEISLDTADILRLRAVAI